MNKKTLIIDFDSTISSLEMLDELAKLISKKYMLPHLLDDVEKITKQGMEGKIPFSESLAKRLDMFTFQKKDLDTLIQIINQSVSKEFKSFVNKFSSSLDILIISGGFKNVIDPILEDYKIELENVYANSLIFDVDGNYRGYDKNNLLAQDNGKAKLVDTLNLNKDDVIVVGDGWSDYQIKESGLAKKFIAFTGNKKRESVVKVADGFVNDFLQLGKLL